MLRKQRQHARHQSGTVDTAAARSGRCGSGSGYRRRRRRRRCRARNCRRLARPRPSLRQRRDAARRSRPATATMARRTAEIYRLAASGNAYAPARKFRLALPCRFPSPPRAHAQATNQPHRSPYARQTWPQGSAAELARSGVCRRRRMRARRARARAPMRAGAEVLRLERSPARSTAGASSRGASGAARAAAWCSWRSTYSTIWCKVCTIRQLKAWVRRQPELATDGRKNFRLLDGIDAQVRLEGVVGL